MISPERGAVSKNIPNTENQGVDRFEIYERLRFGVNFQTHFYNWKYVSYYYNYFRKHIVNSLGFIFPHINITG